MLDEAQPVVLEDEKYPDWLNGIAEKVSLF